MSETRERSQAAELESKGYITIHVAAEQARVVTMTVHRWIDAGKVKGIRIGKSWYVERASLLAFLGEGAKLLGLDGGNDTKTKVELAGVVETVHDEKAAVRDGGGSEESSDVLEPAPLRV